MIARSGIRLRPPPRKRPSIRRQGPANHRLHPGSASPGWSFNMTLYGWTEGLHGDVGKNGGLAYDVTGGGLMLAFDYRFKKAFPRACGAMIGLYAAHRIAMIPAA